MTVTPNTDAPAVVQWPVRGTHWRTLSNGIDIRRETSGARTRYRARYDGWEVGTFSGFEPGLTISGHVNGDFSQVQGPDGARAPMEWLERMEAL